MDNYYTSGAFARKARVSLRTIRYYDKIGLLKPTLVLENGRRLYTDEDFTKLQQILTFKMLGFSLEEIKAMTIQTPDKAFLKDSLSMQLGLVRMQKAQIEQMEQALMEADSFLNNNEQLDLNHMVNLIHLSNVKHALQEQYKTSKNIDARVRLHKECSVNPEGWFSWVYRQCDIRPGMKILELGCGNGALWTDNMKRLPDPVNITLTDISEGLLKETQARLHQELDTHKRKCSVSFSYSACSCEALPFEKESFDLVIANHLLFYLENRDKTYREILRVLKPDGRLIASTYGPKHMQEITSLVQEFHPAITLADKELYEIFGLQNGREELTNFFPCVEMRTYEDALEVSNPQLLIEYILSCHGSQNEYILPRFPEFRDMIQTKLKKKPLHITKDAGLFICTKS